MHGVQEAPIPREYRALGRVHGIGGVICGRFGGNVRRWIDQTVRWLILGGDTSDLLTMFSTLVVFRQQVFQCQAVVLNAWSLCPTEKAMVVAKITQYAGTIGRIMEMLEDVGRAYDVQLLGRLWLNNRLIYQRP